MKFKFLSWNINTDVSRIEEGYARCSYPEWRISNRLGAIVKKITEINPEILNLQETKKIFSKKYQELIDATTPIKDHLENIGYEVLIMPYNQVNSRSSQFITAYKKDKFELLASKVKYLTKTPDLLTIRPDLKDKTSKEIKLVSKAIREHNFGEFFERCVFITHLKHKKTALELLNFNIHLAMPVMHRLESSRLLVQFITQELDINPEAKIVIAGDFNSFANFQGKEQMDIIRNIVINGNSLTEITEAIYLPHGELSPRNNTFIFFPFDFGFSEKIFRNEIANLHLLDSDECKRAINKIFSNKGCNALGDQLDHIFAYKLKLDGKAILDVTPQFNPIPREYNESEIKKYILNHQEGPAFASDHQPIVVKFVNV